MLKHFLLPDSPQQGWTVRDNVIFLSSRQPSLRRSADLGPTGGKQATYAPGFVDLGEFCSIACWFTLRWVERHGTCVEFPRSVRSELERWAHDNIRGVSYVYISPTGCTCIEAKDDWATFRYEVTLNPEWLRAGFGALK